MPPTFEYDVFLSHAHADQDRVRPIAERLRADGVRVWFDDWEIEPGDSSYLKVQHGLNQSRVLVLAMTTASLGREWVAMEHGTALFRDPTNKFRRFVPIRLEECEIPDTLRQYRYIDWITDDAAAYARLLKACRAGAATAVPDNREGVGTAIGAEMIYIPPGPFEMGDGDRPDNPRHTVMLSGYWIYKDLVTVRQYRAFVEANPGRYMPQAPVFNENWKNPDHPIVKVRWHDAVRYAEWAGGTLPSEAQWEKAARWRECDGKSLTYPWGDTFDASKLWCSKASYSDAGGTTAVGSYGISPSGCTDMAGNVWQWCLDAYDSEFWTTAAAGQPDPVNNVTDSSVHCLLRGGSWGINDPEFFRYRVNPTFSSSVVGFRCVFRAGSG